MTQACWISTGTTYWDFRRPWGSPHFATVLAATGCMFVGQCGPNIDWLETSNECINIFWVGHMCHDLIIVSSWYHRIVPLKCSEYPNLSPFLENPFLENPLGSRVTMSFSEKKTPPNLMVYQFYFPILWVLLYPQVPTDRNMRLLVRSLKSSFNSFQKKCSPNIPRWFSILRWVTPYTEIPKILFHIVFPWTERHPLSPLGPEGGDFHLGRPHRRHAGQHSEDHATMSKKTVLWRPGDARLPGGWVSRKIRTMVAKKVTI